VRAAAAASSRFIGLLSSWLAGLVDFGKSQFHENPGRELKLFEVYKDTKSGPKTISSFFQVGLEKEKRVIS
jgi:hypothetical protein